MFSRPVSKHGAFPLATYIQIYQKSDSVDHRGVGTIQKGMPYTYHHGKLEELALLYQQVEARFLPGELMCI